MMHTLWRTHRLEYIEDFFSKRSLAALNVLRMIKSLPATLRWRMSESSGISLVDV